MNAADVAVTPVAVVVPVAVASAIAEAKWGGNAKGQGWGSLD